MANIGLLSEITASVMYIFDKKMLQEIELLQHLYCRLF